MVLRHPISGEVLCVMTAALVAAAHVLATFGTGYGANFDYPNKPPLPPGATVIAQSKGWDDDDPMRGREVVIELGTAPQAELMEVYRKRFPSTAGWRQGTPEPEIGGGHLLCLVRASERRFDEYLEIYPYGRRFKSDGAHRYLASIGRLQVSPEGASARRPVRRGKHLVPIGPVAQ